MPTPSEEWRTVDGRGVEPFARFLERTSTASGGRAPALDLLRVAQDDRVLDVGCGIGGDVASINAATGAWVAGADASVELLARARQASRAPLPFVAARGERLPFADGIFDAVTVKRMLMHLHDPGPVLEEMRRVLRPGGSVVAIEPDSETLLVDSDRIDTTRRILAFRASGYANPWAGRRLRGLLVQVGFRDVQVELKPREFTSLEEAQRILHLLGVAAGARRADEISAEDEDAWVAEQRARDRRGAFCCILLMVRATATR